MTLEEGFLLYGNVEKSDTETKEPYYAAIFFDYIQDESSTVEASITDNYVESNYSLQDHIAIKPPIYRLRGCVGEVLYVNSYKSMWNYKVLKAKHPVFNKTVNAVNNLGALSGIVSNYTQAAINITKQIESSYDRYKQIIDNFRNQTNEYKGKRQKVCYDILKYMLTNRVPISIENLAFDSKEFKENHYPQLYFIQSVSAHQGDNAFISDIEVTIKGFRIATTKTTEIDTKKFAGYSASQTTQEANNGVVKGEELPPEVVKEVQFAEGVKAGIKANFTQPVNAVKFMASKIKQFADYANKEIMGVNYK